MANFAFLTGDCNRSLGKRAPTDYLPEVEGRHSGTLASQWIPHDRGVWELDRYLDFLDMRRRMLADATNALLDGLREGELSLDVISGGGAVADEPSDELQDLSDWCARLGLARPDISGEIVDDETGEPLVYPDAAWPEGMQRGLGEKVALLLEPDEETESRLGELGYRFFTSRRALVHYVEGLLNVDLNGDDIVGPVEEPNAPSVAAAELEVQAEDRGAARGTKRHWDEASFLSDLDRRRNPDEVRLMQDILRWARDHDAEVVWGKGRVYGTCYPNLPVGDRFVPTFGVFSDGQVEIGFWNIAKQPSFETEERRQLLRAKLKEAGIDIPIDGIERWPRTQLNVLTQPGVLSRFEQVWEWYRAEVERCGNAQHDADHGA